MNQQKANALAEEILNEIGYDPGPGYKEIIAEAVGKVEADEGLTAKEADEVEGIVYDALQTVAADKIGTPYDIDIY